MVSVKIESDGGIPSRSTLFLDGKKVLGVQDVKVDLNVDTGLRVVAEIIPTDMEIELTGDVVFLDSETREIVGLSK